MLLVTRNMSVTSLLKMVNFFASFIFPYEIDYQFTVVRKSSKIMPVVGIHTNVIYHDCIKLCAFINSCRAINYNLEKGICEISKNDMANYGIIRSSESWSYIEKDSAEKIIEATDSDTCPKIYPNKGQNLTSIEFTNKSKKHDLYPVFVKNISHLTTCLWFKSTFASRQQFIFSFIENKVNDCNYYFLRLRDNSTTLQIQTLSNLVNVCSVNINQAYHICLKFNSKTGDMVYMNGKNILAKKANTNEKLNFEYLLLGQDTNKVSGECNINLQNKAFIGHIASFYVWETELTDAEIEQVYNNNIPREPFFNWNNFIQNLTQSEFMKISTLTIS